MSDESEHEERGRQAKRRLFFDAYALTASALLSAGLGFVATFVSAKLFDKDQFGRAAGLTAAMFLLSGIASLDLANALHRFLPGSGASARKLIVGSYAAVTVVSFVAAAIFVLVFGADLFGQHRLWAALWFGGVVAAWTLFTLQDQVLMGLGAAILVPVENVLASIGRVALVFALAGGSAYAILATWIAPVLVLIVLVSIFLVVKVLPDHIRKSGDATTIWDLRTVSRFAAAGYSGSVVSIVCNNVLPLFVLSHLGRVATGAFSIAFMLIKTLDFVSINFAASIVVQGVTNPAHIPGLLRAALRKQMLLVGPALFVLAIAAHPVLFFINKDFIGATSVLQLLLVGLAIRLVWGQYLPAARLQGNVKAMVTTQVGSGILTMVASVIGLYLGGLTGLGVGQVIAQLVVAAIVIPRMLPLLKDVPTEAEAERRREFESRLDDEGREAIRLRNGAVASYLINLGHTIIKPFHSVFVNRLARSSLTPKWARFVIYRTFAMRVSTRNISSGVKFSGSKVIIGRRSAVGVGCRFENDAPVTIGSDSHVGVEVLFATSQYARTPKFSSWRKRQRAITIGDRCFIGPRATILPGVSIGNDCVILAGSVITEDCRAAGVYSGVPAKRTDEVARSPRVTPAVVRPHPNRTPRSSRPS